MNKNFLHSSFHIWMLYYGPFMPTLKNKTHPNECEYVHFWAHLCDHFQSPKSNQVGSTSVAAFHAKDNIKICNPIIFPFSWLCSSPVSVACWTWLWPLLENWPLFVQVTVPTCFLFLTASPLIPSLDLDV